MDPILTKHVREPNSFTLDFHLQQEGYSALKIALGKKPDGSSTSSRPPGLRGRGGAGFPTGMKWQFVDKKIAPAIAAMPTKASRARSGSPAHRAQSAPAHRGLRHRLLRHRRESCASV
jgi:NADH:ubiquinone oxidoreductase subunit F (NADH-binding)